jgi:hypothetical protein
MDFSFITVAIITITILGLLNAFKGEGDGNESLAFLFAGLMMLVIISIGIYGIASMF